MPALVSSRFLQTDTLYDIADRTTAVYTCCACVKVALYIKAKILCRASCWTSALRLTSRACAVHCSFESNQTPSTRTSGAGDLMTIPRLRLACRLNFVRCRVKWISSYLVGAKLIPNLRAQSRHLECVFFNVRQLSSVERL